MIQRGHSGDGCDLAQVCFMSVVVTVWGLLECLLFSAHWDMLETDLFVAIMEIKWVHTIADGLKSVSSYNRRTIK